MVKSSSDGHRSLYQTTSPWIIFFLKPNAEEITLRSPSFGDALYISPVTNRKLELSRFDVKMQSDFNNKFLLYVSLNFSIVIISNFFQLLHPFVFVFLFKLNICNSWNYFLIISFYSVLRQVRPSSGYLLKVLPTTI